MICEYCKKKDRCITVNTVAEIINCNDYLIEVENNEDFQTIIKNGYFFSVVSYDTRTMVAEIVMMRIIISDDCYVKARGFSYYVPRNLMRIIFPTKEKAVECLESLGYKVTIFDLSI